MQCQRSGFTLNGGTPVANFAGESNPTSTTLRQNKTKHPPKIVPQRHTQRTRTDKQAFTTDRKTLQCQKDRHSQHAQKHYNIDRDKWRQIEEAPNQSPPRKVTHKHYGGTKVAGGILCLP